MLRLVLSESLRQTLWEGAWPMTGTPWLKATRLLSLCKSTSLNLSWAVLVAEVVEMVENLSQIPEIGLPLLDVQALRLPLEDPQNDSHQKRSEDQIEAPRAQKRQNRAIRCRR